MQERRNSIANTLELRLSCINPSINEWLYPTVWNVITNPYPNLTETVLVKEVPGDDH